MCLCWLPLARALCVGRTPPLDSRAKLQRWNKARELANSTADFFYVKLM